MNVFVAYVRRAITPRFPAAKRPANQSWIRSAVPHGHGPILPIHGKFIVHQKIRGCGIADLLETLRRECLFDGGLHAPANDFVVGIGIAPRRLSTLITPDVVARSNGAVVDRASVAGGSRFFHGGPPGPRGVSRDTHVPVASYLNIFIAPGDENQRKKSTSGQKPLGCATRMQIPHWTSLQRHIYPLPY